MTLYDFNVLDRNTQHNVVWEKGVHIGERIEADHRVILYQLFTFYVEMYYYTVENAILKIRSFSSTNCLEPYLKQIDITNITHK